MPNQDPLAENKFSLVARDVRKWLKNLPYVDQDLAVQQFYDGLKRSNRQAHATKQRLAAIEIIRPVAHDFLKNQRKYLTAQPFPLSKKATEVLKLQQNILNELAAAYKIIIQETVNRDGTLGSKKLVTCVHHAMYYQLEQYITLAQVYSEPPQSFWQDLCQMYGIAEHFELTELLIKNKIDPVSPKSSPKSLFIHACLLSLSNLHTYGHGEAEKIATYLNHNRALTNLSDIAPTESEQAFYINLALRKPVRLLPDEEVPLSTKNRYIDASKLVEELKETSNRTDSEDNKENSSNYVLDKSLSKRLLNKLISKPIRSSKRAVPTKGRLLVVMGLRDAIEVLQSGHVVSRQTTTQKPNLELMSLPISMDSSRVSTFFNDNDNDEKNNYNVSSANAWDWVSRGNVVSESSTNSSTNNENQNNITQDKNVTLNPVIQTWGISNASKGGYCLNSSNTSDYQSQVGDIILLRLEDKQSDAWRLGVIRWMQSLSERGVKMGIETLHGSIKVLEVVDAHISSKRHNEFDHILEITEQTASGMNKTIITPPNSASTGDSLVLRQNNKSQNVVFQHKLEQTISFARFSYSETPSMPTRDEN
jgi:hypothetical protein